MNPKDLKLIVQGKYGDIARKPPVQNQNSCCGSSCCGDKLDYTVFRDDYAQLDGYNSDADLGLGCGTPTQYAGIKEGQNVLDLGSGAGNDCFVARAFVGDKGQITGIDFTDAMIAKAESNRKKTGFNNITFVKGDIEQMPFANNTFDVVISNCVLNLVPDKEKAFGELFRVLKQDGHFCISDVVLQGELPAKLQLEAEMYAGCISGALQKEKYLNLIKEQGFTRIEINTQKEIKIPEATWLNYLTQDELNTFKQKKIGIFSITISAYK